MLLLKKNNANTNPKVWFVEAKVPVFVVLAVVNHSVVTAADCLRQVTNQ
jgi:hypothetical protein